MDGSRLSGQRAKLIGFKETGENITDVACENRRRHQPDRLVPEENIPEREVPLRLSNHAKMRSVETYYDLLVGRADHNGRNHDWKTKEMKTKLVTKMHGYQQIICQKVPNPGNQDQANEQE